MGIMEKMTEEKFTNDLQIAAEIAAALAAEQAQDDADRKEFL